MPSSVADSTSTSSTPIVYLAITRSPAELSMTFRLIGALRIDVPMSASQPVAIWASSPSLLPWGVSHDALPRRSSHPASWSFAWVTLAAA